MEVVNPFILKNKERMIVFLDQLSSVTDPNPPPNSYIEASTSHLCADAGKTKRIILLKELQFPTTFFSPPSNQGRELATLHHICVSYLSELQAIAKTNTSLKKLVTVTDMLTKHKIKYIEMIS